MLKYFKEVFTKDMRGEFPHALLQTMQWKTCNACGIQFATSSCPVCTLGHVHSIAPMSVSGNLQIREVFVTDGTIVFADIQQGKLLYVYHNKDEYRRENERIVFSGPLSRTLHIAINGTSTVLSQSHTMAVVDDSGAAQKLFIDCVGTRPVCVADDHQIFWVENGNIYKSNPFGLGYSPIAIGQAIIDNTLLWKGPNFGFGLYKAGDILQGFMFDNQSKVINDNVHLPFIKGQIIDVKTYISDHLAWCMIAVKDQSKYINHCIVIDTQGKILTHIDNETIDEPWLSHIKGKSASGTYLFCPTDDGIMRVGMTPSGDIETKVFEGTESIVNEHANLLVSPAGIYVIKKNKILLVSIK